MMFRNTHQPKSGVVPGTENELETDQDNQGAVEIWRPVIGYEDFYSVSNLGRVKSHGRVSNHSDGRSSTRHPRMMKPVPNPKSGYLAVGLSDCGAVSMRYVHHLVLEAFVGPMPEGLEACHGDGNRANNRLSNLRWGTRASNAADRIEHGTAAIGIAHPMAKLTEQDVLALRRRHAEGASATTLANEFNVSRMTAFRAATGRSWSHLK